MNVKHGKMTQQRKDELLTKITQVANNDVATLAGVEKDIRVVKSNENGEIIIDMVVHFIKTDENAPELINVSYAAALARIQNASISQQERAQGLMTNIIQTSLGGMNMPGGDEAKAEIQKALEEQSKQEMTK